MRDDGIGFLPGADPAGLVAFERGGDAQGGFGLAAMRRRVEGVSGTLEIESEPRVGTAISASVPAIPAGTAP